MLSMKNVITILFISFLIIGNLLAQEINYGLSFGYNRAIPHFDKEYNHENITPENYFNIMGLLEISGNPNSRVQLGLKYFKIGYTSEYKPDYSVRYIAPPAKSTGSTLSFLAIPIDINYILPFLSEIYLSGGVEGTYLLSANSYSKNYDGTHVEWDTTDRFRNFNILLMVGIGAEFKIGNFTFFVEPEYSRSIRHVTKSSDSSTSFKIEQISLTVGFKL